MKLRFTQLLDTPPYFVVCLRVLIGRYDLNIQILTSAMTGLKVRFEKMAAYPSTVWKTILLRYAIHLLKAKSLLQENCGCKNVLIKRTYSSK